MARDSLVERTRVAKVADLYFVYLQLRESEVVIGSFLTEDEAVKVSKHYRRSN